MLTQARTHAPPPPPPQKKGLPNGTVKDFKKTNNKNKSVVLGLTTAFPVVWKTSIFYFYPGEHASGPPLKNPSRVSNRSELDENIPILLENPNRDSISVGIQEQLSQANN